MTRRRRRRLYDLVPILERSADKNAAWMDRAIALLPHERPEYNEDEIRLALAREIVCEHAIAYIIWPVPPRYKSFQIRCLKGEALVAAWLCGGLDHVHVRICAIGAIDEAVGLSLARALADDA